MLLIPSSLLIVWLQLFGQSAPIYTALPLLSLAGLLFAGRLLTGIPGCLLGIRAKKVGDQNMRRITIRGIILSSGGIVVALFLCILFPAAFQSIFVEPFLP